MLFIRFQIFFVLSFCPFFVEAHTIYEYLDSISTQQKINQYDSRNNKDGIWYCDVDDNSYFLYNYKEGELDGLSGYYKYYNNRHVPILTCVYRSGFPSEFRMFDDNGVLISVDTDFSLNEDFLNVPADRFMISITPIIQRHSVELDSKGHKQSEGYYLSTIRDLEGDVEEVGIWHYYDSNDSIREIKEFNPGYKSEENMNHTLKLSFNQIISKEKINTTIINKVEQGNKRTGKWLQQYGYGFSITEYKDDKLSGKYVLYLGSEKSGYYKWLEGKFKNNRPVETWKGYHPNGGLYFELSLFKKNHIKETGKLPSIRDNLYKFYCKIYNEDGKLFAEGWLEGNPNYFINSISHVGEWTLYDENGKSYREKL